MTADIKRYRENLRDELNGSELYAALAAAEPDPLRKDLFLQLGQARAGHAQLWRGKLAAAGIQDGPRRSHDTLAREELGIDPTELGGNPWSAAATSFALFGSNLWNRVGSGDFTVLNPTSACDLRSYGTAIRRRS